MNPKIVNDKIIRYFNASQDAEQNTCIMCGNPTTEMVDACARRMSVLGQAEEDLFSLDGETDLPQPLADHLAARKDPGCVGCWITSNPRKLHAECKKKINRYFETRKGLEEYGRELKKLSASHG